ncbi:hypothetical protein MHYP_G00348540 [Metynnis hypsauchen]
MYEFISSALIKMKLCLILICAVLRYTEAKYVHKDIALYLCSETEKEKIHGLDGEEMWHADFIQGKGVMTMPQFADPVSFSEGAYENAVSQTDNCKRNLEVCIRDAPQSSIFSKDDVELGSKNTLICYITGFYPPHVGVSWTRNNVNVTDEASFSRYYINSDRTYKLVSHLSFTPEIGDIYTCTVEHTALDRPLTKTWDVQVALPSVGPSVLCGLGVVAGLLGVAVGTFFLIKGKNYGYYLSTAAECISSSLPDLTDVEFVESDYFNKDLLTQFNSTVGKFVGFGELGEFNAENWNNSPLLTVMQGEVDRYCKPNLQAFYSAILDKTVKPKIQLRSEQQASGGHPAMLMCSAYNFYPPFIDVYWLRDGQKVTTDTISTEEMADGDWYYQIHSHLEYKPKSGEKISCVVDHASSKEPIIVDWDNSLSRSERDKTAIGASGLVLGIIFSAGGFFYYKRKTLSQWR